MAEWTERVGARTKLALMLKGKLPRAVAAGLVEEDLDEIIQQGKAAEEADQDQRAQLAQLQVSRRERSVNATTLKEDEDALRDRLLPVVGDLNRMGEAQQALWLSTVSYKRYRVRELAPADPGGAAAAEEESGEADREDDEATDAPGAAEAPKRVRVERLDAPSRFRGTAGFCRGLLAPERAVIVARLAARGFSRDKVESLGQDAKALADQGSNLLQAAEATARESKAVEAQQARWSECRRMIKKACIGDAELAVQFAKC